MFDPTFQPGDVSTNSEAFLAHAKAAREQAEAEVTAEPTLTTSLLRAASSIFTDAKVAATNITTRFSRATSSVSNLAANTGKSATVVQLSNEDKEILEEVKHVAEDLKEKAAEAIRDLDAALQPSIATKQKSMRTVAAIVCGLIAALAIFTGILAVSGVISLSLLSALSLATAGVLSLATMGYNISKINK